MIKDEGNNEIKKHAYLIMSHGNFKILKCLLELIDDFRNDIFIHIDAKVQKFNFSLYESYCKVSRIFFIKNRVDVKWGGI